jgi:phosphatidylserine/phosphatidylglycerophosphate/cardiolipin synthase-like enzyme
VTGVEVVKSPWDEHLASLAGGARRALVLCAPYVSRDGAELVIRARAQAPAGCAVTVVTDLSPEPVSRGATDPDAVARIRRSLPGARVVHLPRLHAKVYAADASRAVVTSGNLTAGGLRTNLELGLSVTDPALAASVQREALALAALGADLDPDALVRVCSAVEHARAAREAVERDAAADAKRRLRDALRAAGDELLRARLGGGAMHTVFARTIRYLLERSGPLPTRQLHPLIQQIHPDLCDDTVDRVIDGENFGKKWKHAVRTAQQQLKSDGEIELRDGAWRLVADGSAYRP